MNLLLVGATGLVGEKIISLIEEYKMDFDNIYLKASKKSKGKIVIINNKEYIIDDKINDLELENSLCILCVDKEVSNNITPYLLNKGAAVIDCSTRYRKDVNIPLIAMGVNENSIENNTLICNPNCVVMQIILPLKMIRKSYDILGINLVSFQSVSGSGNNGIYALENENNNQFYPYNIKETVIPKIGEYLDNGYTEEEDKIQFEIKKILNDKKIKISSTCVRVPIKHCHGIALSIELNKYVSAKKIISIILENPNCVYMDIPNSTNAYNNDYVYFGRVRNDLDNPNIIHMFIVGDNLRRGAASNALMIAKYILEHEKR